MMEKDGTAAYAPTGSITTVLETFRNRSVPTPIELDSIVRMGVSESLAPRTHQALRLLDLLDDEGNPTEAMEDLRKASSDEDYRALLADVLRSAYAEVFAFTDPAVDDVQKVRGAFRGFKPVGMQDRMVRLFLGLCEYAGLITEVPRVSGNRPPRPRTNGGGRAPAQRGRTERAAAAAERDADSPPQGALPSSNLFVQGLIQNLPRIGSEWSDADRKNWVAAAEAVFKIIYTLPKAKEG